MTWGESVLTAVSLSAGLALAVFRMQKTWTWVQCLVSCILAIINASAVPQCATGTSKRWYHKGGRLSNFLVGIILFEITLQLLMVHFMFPTVSSFELQLQMLLAEACAMITSIILIQLAPLHLQRPVSLMIATLMLIMVLEGPLPSHAGINWYRPLLIMKYCVSHVPRHEPYVYY